MSIEGITKVKPHNDTITFITFKFLCLFSARANGIANMQLINEDKKAWYKEKKMILWVYLFFKKINSESISKLAFVMIPIKGNVNIIKKILNTK